MYLLESPRRGDSNKYPKAYVFKKNSTRLSIKSTRSADFCADRIDVITNFAVITNAVIKRAHCKKLLAPYLSFSSPIRRRIVEPYLFMF